MGRQPCCDKVGLKRGPWTIEEDNKLMNFILNNGIQCWRLVPKLAGLLRCGKSCRLRWINYLRPDLKRGAWTEAEEDMVIQLHSRLGNRWSKIATHFPGRTDNEIKNHWNTKIKKKLKLLGLDPLTHKPLITDEKTHHHDEKSDHDQDQDQGMIQEYYSTTSSSGEQQEKHEISTEETTVMMNNNTADDQQKSNSDNSNGDNNLACMFMEMKPAAPCTEMNGNAELLLDSFYMGIGHHHHQHHLHHHQLEDSFHNWINSPLPWDLFTSSDDNFL